MTTFYNVTRINASLGDIYIQPLVGAEFFFDELRDQMAESPDSVIDRESLNVRGHHFSGPTQDYFQLGTTGPAGQGRYQIIEFSTQSAGLKTYDQWQSLFFDRGEDIELTNIWGWSYSAPSYQYTAVEVPDPTLYADQHFVFAYVGGPPPTQPTNVVSGLEASLGIALTAVPATFNGPHGLALSLDSDGDVTVTSLPTKPVETTFAYTITAADGRSAQGDLTVDVNICEERARAEALMEEHGVDLRQSVRNLRKVEGKLQLAEDLLDSRQEQYEAAGALQTLKLLKWASEEIGDLLGLITAFTPLPPITSLLDALKISADLYASEKLDAPAFLSLIYDTVSNAAGKKLKTAKEIIEKLDDLKNGGKFAYDLNKKVYDLFDPNKPTPPPSEFAQARTQLLETIALVQDLREAEAELRGEITAWRQTLDELPCDSAAHQSVLQRIREDLTQDGWAPALDGPIMPQARPSELFQGSGGGDVRRGGSGDDLHFGGGGRDELSGRSGDDGLFGGNGGDRLAGQAGADALDGGRGADLLLGGSGRDLLAAGAGRDTLKGGGGDDIFHFDQDDGRALNTIADFGGGDRIRIEGSRWKDVTLSKAGKDKTRLETEDGLRVLLHEKRSDVDRSDFILGETELLLA